MFFWSRYVRPYEKRLIEKNRKYWQSSENITEGTEWIYVCHPTQDYFLYAIYENIIAKGLQKKTKLPIASINYGGACRQMFEDLDSSFGIQTHSRLLPETRLSAISRLRVRIAAWYFSRTTYGKKEKLLKVKYRGVKCGDALLDSMIRLGLYNKPVFDCFDLPKEIFYKYIRDAISLIDNSYTILKKRKPRYIVTVNQAFFWSLFLEVGNLLGAEVLHSSPQLPGLITRLSGEGRGVFDIKMQDIIRNNLDKKSSVDSAASNYFVLDFKTAKVENLREKLGIRNSNKNVFIMLHGLTDAPRQSAKLELYNDYNEWFIDTLRVIRTIKNVNWIIKEHPLASYYGQDNYVKKIVESSKAENIFYCEKTISGDDVKSIADCVITCAGDVGIEYWAYGISTITLAETYYTHLGISYRMKSIAEYYETLGNIEKLPCPDQQSVNIAKGYLDALHKIRKGDDELSVFFSESDHAELMSYKSSNIEEFYYVVRKKICDQYMDLLDTNAINTSAIFTLQDL